MLNWSHICPHRNVNRKGPGKPLALRVTLDISTSGTFSLLTGKEILEVIFKLVSWKHINLQHLLDDEFISNIPFIPIPKKPAKPTSQLQMQWILDSIRVKHQSSCAVHNIWMGHSRYTMLHYQSFCCSREKHGHQLTWIGCGNNVNNIWLYIKFLTTHTWAPFASPTCSDFTQLNFHHSLSTKPCSKELAQKHNWYLHLWTMLLMPLSGYYLLCFKICRSCLVCSKEWKKVLFFLYKMKANLKWG